MSTISLVNANLSPKDDTSNKNIGIFVVDQAPINIKTFLKLTFFFINTAANGKAPYRGPAAAEPINMAINTPLIPEPSPIYFTIISFETQISKSPKRIKIGGITIINSLKELKVMVAAFNPISLLTIYNVLIGKVATR